MDRFNLVRESFMKKARPVDTPEGRPSEYFGELTKAASRWTGRRPTASPKA